MTSLLVSIGSLAVVLGALLLIQRNWLTLARTERLLAASDRNLAVVFQWRQPALASERLAAAARHDALAVKYTRRAWPWKPKEDA